MFTSRLGPMALLLAVGCTAQVEVTTDDTADREAIIAVRDAEVASVMSGDASMPYAAEDVAVMPPGAAPAVGRAAAQAWAEGFMSAVNVQDVVYTESNITISGDLAVEQYAGSLTMTMGEDGAPVTEVMKGVHVYRRGADGTWKMTLDIWNTNAPPAGM